MHFLHLQVDKADVSLLPAYDEAAELELLPTFQTEGVCLHLILGHEVDQGNDGIQSESKDHQGLAAAISADMGQQSCESYY